MTEKKLLITQEQIDIHYPEHAKMRAHQAEIDAIERFIHSLAYHTDHRICKKGYDEQYDEELEQDITMEVWRPTGTYDWDWRGYVFALFGIEIAEWWREKDDMIQQMRLAQGVDDDDGNG